MQWKSGSVIAITLAALVSLGCSDPAVRLRFQVADQVRALEQAGSDRGTFTPVTRVGGGHWLVLFPEGRTTGADLDALGVPQPVVDRIFRELDYVGVGSGAMIVVVPDVGRLSFTGPQNAEIAQLTVAYCSVVCPILLEDEAGRWTIQQALPDQGTSDESSRGR